MSEGAEIDDFKFFGLGGCNEVGRSCHIIEYKNKIIMLDAGVHPGLPGLCSLPFYDEYDLSKVDILLISHFHLDHAASLPYVMQRTNFKGRVFMTHATKAIYRWLLSDFVRVTSIGEGGGGDAGLSNATDRSSNLYTDEDLMTSFDKIETIDYHSTIETDGIRFTAYHAGHVLGACMYFIEIGGLKVLFTGDYSREDNRHLQVAEVPPMKPDILITESTFGTATHEPRLEKEARMMSLIHSCLLKGGRILMPTFALGRAQELLLILEEYWSENEDLQNISIYYASSLARKCMAVYQTYTNIMNDRIRLSASSTSEKQNPFDFKYIKSIRNLSKFQDFGPSVVVASPGMLQNGVSRELLERWAPDPKNAVIMTGYSIEGTMAKDLLAEPTTIPSIMNPEMTIPRRLDIEEISFAAHVDFQENADFIDQVNPLKIILVHGESNPMGRLKSALLSKYASRKGTDQEIKVFNPRNCDELKINFKGLKIAKAIGILADVQIGDIREKITEILDSQQIKDEDMEDEVKEEENKNGNEKNENENKENGEKENVEGEVIKKTEEAETLVESGKPVSGVLVSKDFELNLLQLEDLHEFSQLSTSIVKSKINLKVNSDITLLQWHLEQMFGYIHIVNDSVESWECLIMDMISIVVDKSKNGGLYIIVEWINDNLMADSLADSVVAILYSIDSSPASVKLSSKTHHHHHHKSPVKIEETDEIPSGTVSESSITSRVRRISRLLIAQFGDAYSSIDGKTSKIKIGNSEAKIDFDNLTVDCPSKILKSRVENIIQRGCGLAAPLSQFEKS